MKKEEAEAEEGAVYCCISALKREHNNLCLCLCVRELCKY